MKEQERRSMRGGAGEERRSRGVTEYNMCSIRSIETE